MSLTILIVDDEDSVRRTFEEWLRTSGLDCEVLSAGDAEAALTAVSRTGIDLAVLDWNLGSGSDGLQLLEDLVEFHPDLVAILVTGFAHQATPLQALRMGVRDYLDKNQDLNRESFLGAVRRQLERILPAKRQRQFTRSLQSFRDALQKVLPLVEGASRLNDPVPLSEGTRQLFAFLRRTTSAAGGVVVVHVQDAPGGYRAYSSEGEPLADALVPFARSLAATVVSMQEPGLLNHFDPASLGPVELQPFERGRAHLLVAPIRVGPGAHVVLELLDRLDGTPFTEADRRLVAAACGFAAELFRHALAERETQTLLIQAIESALGASQKISGDLAEGGPDATERAVRSVREGLATSLNPVMGAAASVRLSDAIRTLATRHGDPAVAHCVGLVEGLTRLLDGLCGEGEGR